MKKDPCPKYQQVFPGASGHGPMKVLRTSMSECLISWYRTSLRETKPEVLLCDAGYLTVHSQVPNGNSVRLGVPNREMKRALEKALSAAASGDAGQSS